MAPSNTDFALTTIAFITSLLTTIFAEKSVKEFVLSSAQEFVFSGFDPELIINNFVAKEPDNKVLFYDMLVLAVVVSIRGTNIVRITTQSTSEAGKKKLKALQTKYGILENKAGKSAVGSMTLNRFCVVFAPFVREVRKFLFAEGLLTLLVPNDVCPAEFQFIGAWEVVLEAGGEAKEGYMIFLEEFEARLGVDTTSREEKEVWMKVAERARRNSGARDLLLNNILVPFMEVVVEEQLSPAEGVRGMRAGEAQKNKEKIAEIRRHMGTEKKEEEEEEEG